MIDSLLKGQFVSFWDQSQMTFTVSPIRERKLSIRKKLILLEEKNSLPLKMIELLAGDKTPTEQEKQDLKTLKSKSGMQIYADIILALTYQIYKPLEAKKIWQSILEHKVFLNQQLKRNVGIRVAALDYTINISRTLKQPMIIGKEPFSQIAEIALKDSLTGLFDKGTFLTKIEEEIERARRYKNRISLILLDIDHFKVINDSFGHLVGDQVLKKMSQLILTEIRQPDLAARYGGEEIGILLPQTDIKRAIDVANRLRRKIFECFEQELFKVSVSGGVATYPIHARRSTTLIKKADMALYWAKHNGRNQICKWQR